LKICY